MEIERNCNTCIHDDKCAIEEPCASCAYADGERDNYEAPHKEPVMEEIKMKKLFISCPMKGRTEENIRKSMEKMHKIAEIIFDQELEVIPSYIEGNPPETNDQRIWYLGESIKKMSEADYFIGISYSEIYKGCAAERNIARDYGIRSTYVEMHELMPDAVDIEREFFKSMMACSPIKD